MKRKPIATWPVYLLALPAFVAIWSGWVGLGKLAGFGPMNLLPGIVDDAVIDTSITLPIGMETYAAYALRVWMSGRAPARARRFARTTAISSLVVGSLGQIGYHLMAAVGWTAAPWPVVVLVSCVPVAVLGMGAGLVHLIRENDDPVDEPKTEQIDLDQVLDRPGLGEDDEQIVTPTELWERYSEPVDPLPERARELSDEGFVSGSSEPEQAADDWMIPTRAVDQVADRRRSDDELWRQFGDQLCAEWIKEDGLSRYRIEKVTGASMRQAKRLLDRVEQTVGDPTEVTS